MSKTFVLDREGKFVTLYQIYLWLDPMIGVIFNFEEIGSWDQKIEKM